MILALAAAAALQPANETPRAFVEHLYAAYTEPDFSPFTHPERIFAPPLLAAIAEDSRLSQGEVGYLDGDPVCQCQDATGLRATITELKQPRRDKAEVRVSIGLLGYEPRPATLALIRTRDGWRISDISSPDEPSLLRGISESNRKAARQSDKSR
jgi:hypothetical protein